MNAIAPFAHSSRQIALIQNTVAKDCNAGEFDLFIEVARAKGLDPFLGQIIPMIFSKDDAKKRKMTIIISRDGQRVIAQRCGDYRPASKPPVYELDTELKGSTNPQGIVSVTTYLWKRDPKTTQWFEVAGQAYWEEFAPIKTGADEYEWVDTGEVWEDSGKPKKMKKPVGDTRLMLDDSGNWCRMPRLMIAKCAEMQALRAGWPEQFTGLYDEAELDRAKMLDLTASEIVEHEREENRLKLIAGNDAITVTWGDGWVLENVPVGKFFDRAEQFINESDAATVAKWADANRDPLRTFWAKSPTDALELKKLIEAAAKRRAMQSEAA
ncbi:phage recombination protein Bet [Phyllobacterium zundukense]|uniref:Phage recombination protein Bet n=1 Tax=Phyllobacterium zundukense TaxID=1867719 RepID=A0A2N9VW16_9HYPH|nr:phage recombination protein Bet [Phyllobacterium zundukense]ATU91417.1 phage recombination protein Bet [Phyllobacterium zundukense]PIO43684.1 phage recombination protein Bet [Phyllobacterium zundukense]